jgi:hypothetical protein
MVAAEIIRSPIDKANHTLLNLANSLKRGKPRQVAAFFISETGPTLAIGTSPTSGDVRFLVVIGGRADILPQHPKRRF